MEPAPPSLRAGEIELAPLQPSHAADYIRICNEPSIAHRINTPFPFEPKHFDEVLNDITTKDRYFVWMILQAGAVCGIVNTADMRKVGIFQGGYWVLPEFRGKGIASQAVALVRDFVLGRYGAKRIQAFVEPDNQASMRVMEKCGYEREGLLRRYFPSRTRELLDVHIYAIVRNDDD